MHNRLGNFYARGPRRPEEAVNEARRDLGFVNAIHQINIQAGDHALHPTLDLIHAQALGVLRRYS